MAYRAIIVQPWASFATSTEFRIWGLMIHDALIAMGHVQTADTGQIDWVTVVKPAGASTVAGFEIWRFNDALQATAPVFFKLEYGTGNGAGSPSVWLTVGTGSNGAGTITGLTSLRTQSNAANITNTNPHSNFFSGDTNRFFIGGNFYAPTGGTGSWGIGLERQLNASGAVVGDGCYIILGHNGQMGSGFNIRQEYWKRTGGGLGLETDPGIHVPGWVNSSGLDGPNVSTFPQYFADGAFLPFGLNVFAYFNIAIPVNQEVTFNVYGVPHTYYTLGGTFFFGLGVTARGGPVGVSWMARYDP